jgi:uncharacterized protein involved in tolerance to divalent cations
MTEYYQAWLSAETQKDAKEILNSLTRLKLIVGGTIISGPSHFWWKGKKLDMNYCYVMCFTIVENKNAIEKKFQKLSKEEIPMVSFVKIEGNKKFLEYVYTNTK